MAKDEFQAAIREVLLRDWDPHEAARTPQGASAYDSYLGPLCDLLKSGAELEAIMEWLHEREKESMCFPSLGKERLRRVARKLRQIGSGN